MKAGPLSLRVMGMLAYLQDLNVHNFVNEVHRTLHLHNWDISYLSLDY